MHQGLSISILTSLKHFEVALSKPACIVIPMDNAQLAFLSKKLVDSSIKQPLQTAAVAGMCSFTWEEHGDTNMACRVHLWQMEFKGPSLEEAAKCVVEERTLKGTVGLDAVSAKGEIAMPYNTTGMFRACVSKY